MSETYFFKDLGAPSLMIGVNITISDSFIKLDQSHYIRSLAEKFGQLSAAKVHCPASTHGCLAHTTDAEAVMLDLTVYPYLSLVGGLFWATITRPDVVTVVSRACHHSKAPTRAR